MKLKNIFVLLAVCGLFASALAQTKNEQKQSEQIRTDREKPTIYITYERSGKFKSERSGENKERVWLRLHNNTRWAIWIEASGEEKQYGDASLYYDVLSKGEALIESVKCHVCSIIPIGANKTVLFSIPQEHLASKSSLRVSFHYNWENDENLSAEGEPIHYVYFDSGNLPTDETQP